MFTDRGWKRQALLCDSNRLGCLSKFSYSACFCVEGEEGFSRHLCCRCCHPEYRRSSIGDAFLCCSCCSEWSHNAFVSKPMKNNVTDCKDDVQMRQLQWCPQVERDGRGHCLFGCHQVNAYCMGLGEVTTTGVFNVKDMVVPDCRLSHQARIKKV